MAGRITTPPLNLSGDSGVRHCPPLSAPVICGMVSGMTKTPALTIAQAAEYLTVSERTIRRWIKRGELPAVKVAGTVRIRLEDLDATTASA